MPKDLTEEDMIESDLDVDVKEERASKDLSDKSQEEQTLKDIDKLVLEREKKSTQKKREMEEHFMIKQEIMDEEVEEEKEDVADAKEALAEEKQELKEAKQKAKATKALDEIEKMLDKADDNESQLDNLRKIKDDPDYNPEFVAEQERAKKSETGKELAKQTFLGKKSRKGEPVKKESKQARELSIAKSREKLQEDVLKREQQDLSFSQEREARIARENEMMKEQSNQGQQKEREAEIVIEERKRVLLAQEIKEKEAENIRLKEQVESSQTIESSKSEREKQIERRIKVLETQIPILGKKDVEKFEEATQEKSDLQNELSRITSEKSRIKEQTGITDDAEIDSMISRDVSDVQSRLNEARENKQKKEQLLIQKRETLSEAAKIKLERDIRELSRKEIKLKSEQRSESRSAKIDTKFSRLKEKQDKLKIQSDIIALKAKRAQNSRIIQAKRRELLEKNLAFAAVRGGFKQVQKLRERSQKRDLDQMLTGSPDETGNRPITTIGDSSISDLEQEKEFDLIKVLAGEEFGSSNDKVGNKIKLL